MKHVKEWEWRLREEGEGSVKCVGEGKRREKGD